MTKTKLLEVAHELEVRCDELGIELHGRADMTTRRDLVETHIDDLEDKIASELETREWAEKHPEEFVTRNGRRTYIG